MRSSGHESFCCRYTWLPKAFRELDENPALFADEGAAMVRLGLGKNMVRSVRFWVQAFRVLEPAQKSNRELAPTRLGKFIFGKKGVDRYLEDIQTLWLLHWNLVTNPNPLLAWDELFFRWPTNEFTRSEALVRFAEQAEASNMRATQRTLQQHFDILVRTYMASGSDEKLVLEDSLDCPLNELGLLHMIGHKRHASGTSDPVFSFRRDPKPDISPQLFMYCLEDFWQAQHASEQTLSLQQVANDYKSPGKALRMPEAELRLRLEYIEPKSSGYFRYDESINMQQIHRRGSDSPDFLASIYAGRDAHG